ILVAPPTSSACGWRGASASAGRGGKPPARCTEGGIGMDLSLTESQEMLKVATRSFMEREAPTDLIVGLQRAGSDPPPQLWRKASDLGWLGILIPPEYGGSGESLSTAAVLYEELGRGPMPGAFFGSGALGALTVMASATEEQRRQILPAAARGERTLSVAIT